MDKLYGFTYNEEQWAVKRYRIFPGCMLVNKQTFDSYNFLGDEILVLTQIDDDSFLICKVLPQLPEQLRIFKRVRLRSGSVFSTFSESYTTAFFLTDDTILFDNKALYSISKDATVPEFEWLKYKKIKVCIDDEKNFTCLWVIKDLEYLDFSVQVFVDIHSFKPISYASSSLRNNHHIILSNNFTFDDLVREDNEIAKKEYLKRKAANKAIFDAGTQILMGDLGIH